MVSRLGHVAQRDVGGDRDHPQRRPGEHHRDQVAGDAAALGDELGLAGMGEADRVELRLGDRAGDQRRRRRPSGSARPRAPARRASCARLRGRAGPARTSVSVLTRRIGQRVVEAAAASSGSSTTAIGPSQTARDRARRCRPRRRAADLSSAPRLPALRDDLGADPRRVAERDGERRLSRRLSDSRSPRRAGGRADSAARARLTRSSVMSVVDRVEARAR